MIWLAFAAFAGPYEDGVASLRAGNPDQALRQLTDATEADPTSAAAWWERGWANWSLERWSEAVRCWEKVESLDPTHAELNQWLTAARTRTGLSNTPTSAAPIPTIPAEGSIRIAGAGDTMMGTTLRKGERGLAPGDGEVIFKDVAPILQRAAIAFLNMEGALADDLPSTKCAPNSKNCYAFRTPTRYTAGLVSAGIDVVSMANNHAMDVGAAGQEAGMKALDKVGIAHAGRYGDVAYLKREGLTIAVVAAHSGSCCLNVNRPEEVAAAIREADAHADLVVLSFHGGAEGSAARHVPGKVERAYGESRGDVKKLAHAAIDAGADLILGHGPHVLRGMEVYKSRLIVYSLGNFVGYRQFGTRGGYGGTSAIIEVELASNGVLRSATLHPCALDSDGVPHPDPSGAAIAQINELSAADFPHSGVKIDSAGALSW